jgi:NADPH2:quinone reductase
VSISDCEIRRNISSNLIWPILIPNTPGQDFVGRIVYVGDKAEKYSNYRQGDRVCAIGQFLGGNSRYVTVPCTKLVRVPEAVDAAEAACIVRSYLAAYQILYRTGAFEISHSHRILVTGASGAIGRALIEVAKMARAKVYGACSSRHKHFVQFKLGVPWVHSNPENWESLHDIDVVVDCVNYTGNFNDSKVPLARGGVLVCVGSAKYVADAISEQKNKLKELDFNYDSDDDSQYGIGRTVCGAFVPASKKKAVYQSSILGHLPLKISGGVNISIFVTTVTFDLFRNVENNFEACKDDLEMLFARLLRGKLKPLVSHRISLEHVMKAHRMVEYGGLQGTIVCLPHVIRS